MNCNTTRSRRHRNHHAAPIFSNLMNEILNVPQTPTQTTPRYTRPAVNISKTENEYQLHLAAPGFEKTDFSIDVDNNKLTVSADITSSDEKKYRLREFNFGKMNRSFNLPKNVDLQAISANYEAGVLSITLPIAESAKPKSIKIK